MDTLAFFRAILPETGPYYLAVFEGDAGYPKHKSYPSLAMLAQAALSIDAPGTNAVYHACASYKDSHVTLPDRKNPGKTKKYYRVPENLGRMKAFWVDVDCGPDKAAAVPPKGYATKNEARDALGAFCHTLGLPLPMMVSSGNGVHCYWPLTRAIGPKSWQAMATTLKAALAAQGVLADPTRTADAASILRPPGTFNRKGEPRPVKVVYPGSEISPEDFRAALESVSRSPAVSEQVPAYLASFQVNGSALAEHAKYSGPPASAEVVAQHCQQVRRMRDTQGDVGYEVWRGVIGIIRHCSEGAVLAEEWSAERGNTGHESLDWQRRYDTWDAGPTTCAFFLQHHATGCDGCQFREKDGTPKLASPISLGYQVPAAAPAQVVQVETDDGVVDVAVPAKPEGYVWEDGALYRYQKDKDGIVFRSAISDSHFYLTHWMCGADGRYAAGGRMHKPLGGIRDFEIDMRDVASATDLQKSLGGNSIFTSNNKDAAMHLHAYIKDEIRRVKAEAEELNTMTSFGWRPDMSGFLIGERLYHTDGTVRKVLVGGAAQSVLEAFPEPRGALQGYCRAVNYVYARKGMEAMQYALCNAFGCVLTPFSGEALYNGVLFALTGERTARGKTTVAMAGLYAFGNAERMKHTKETTVNARYAHMGVHNHLPLLFDEFTDIAPDKLSSWAYSTSEGREKSRMQAGNRGLRLADTASWAFSPYVTANTDLHARLTQLRSNVEAESVRLVQIDIGRYPLPQLDPNQDPQRRTVSDALGEMARNMGHAGEAFVQYVVAHLEEVMALIAAIKNTVDAKIDGVEYRYYRAHAAVTLAAAQILIDLGMVNFDYAAMFDFAIDLMGTLSTDVAAAAAMTPEDHFNEMVRALSPGIISTDGYQDSRQAPPEEVRMFQSPLGRYVAGTSKTPAMFQGRLWVTCAAVREWCVNNRVPLKVIADLADDPTTMGQPDDRVVLTRGTRLAAVRARCYWFDTKKMGSATPLSLVHSADGPMEAAN